MAPIKSSARVFFEYISAQSDGFGYLSSVPDPKAAHAPFFETEWLDFKGAPRDDNDAKKIWSKALSGFANVTDGLIVWGIDARKTPPKDIDAACGLRLIRDTEQFESKLRDWIRDATNPPVMGVEYARYPGPDGEGFLVCLVPESTYKPHRAEWAERQYFIRVGDDFIPAEPGLLRMLFFPQKSCLIDVNVSMHYELVYPDWPHELPSSKLSIVATLSIGGRSTGRDVYLTVLSRPPLAGGLGIGKDWRCLPTEDKRLAFQATRPLHPGESVPLFSCGAPKVNTQLRIQKRYRVLSWESIEFEFEIFVSDQERKTEHLVIEAGTSVAGEKEGSVSAKPLLP